MNPYTHNFEGEIVILPSFIDAFLVFSLTPSPRIPHPIPPIKKKWFKKKGQFNKNQKELLPSKIKRNTKSNKKQKEIFQ